MYFEVLRSFEAGLGADLAFIQANFSFLPHAITSLEKAGLPLRESLEDWCVKGGGEDQRNSRASRHHFQDKNENHFWGKSQF